MLLLRPEKTCRACCSKISPFCVGRAWGVIWPKFPLLPPKMLSLRAQPRGRGYQFPATAPDVPSVRSFVRLQISLPFLSPSLSPTIKILRISVPMGDQPRRSADASGCVRIVERGKRESTESKEKGRCNAVENQQRSRKIQKTRNSVYKLNVEAAHVRC